jgi:TusE/DsrC/DsvC family sulfur relay protein
MQTALHAEALPELDEVGLLKHPQQWNEQVAEELARMSGIAELSHDHWLVIFALRDYFKKFGVAPAMKHVCSSFQKESLWVHDLFGSCLNAWCVAGLPDPGEEAKSYLSDM